MRLISFFLSVLSQFRDLHTLVEVCAEAVGHGVAHQNEDQHADGYRVGHLVVALLRVGKGQIGHGLGGGSHHDDDQIQLLGNGDEGQHEAGDEAVFRQRHDDGTHPLPEAGAGDICRFLQLHADGEHIGGTGLAGEGEVLDHRGQHDQGKGAVQGGHQSAEMRPGEHGEIHGGESNAAHQVGHEHHLLRQVAVPLATAPGTDIAQELAADGGDDGADEGQADGVPEGTEELGIPEDAFVVGVLGNLAGLADPVVEGQVIQPVAGAGGDLEGFHNQHEEGHHHGQEEEYHQKCHQRLLGLAQRHQRGTAALAADGGIGLADAYDPLVGEDDDGSQQHQHDGHGVAHGLGALVDEVAHLGGQGIVADAVAQVGGHAVSTDGFADGHDGGGQHGG